MTKHYVTLLTLLMLFSLLNSICYAGDEYISAALRLDKMSIEKRVKFPKVDGDVDITIPCSVTVQKNGTMTSNICYTKRIDNFASKFERRIQTAASRAKLRPAKVNGVPVVSWVLYSVRFERTDGNEKISAFLNHGHNSQLYPNDFVAAQRYRRRGPKRSDYFFGCGVETSLWVAAEVDEKGVASKAQIIAGSGKDICKKNLVEQINSTQFFPALSEGVPVKSSYVGLFFSLASFRGR